MSDTKRKRDKATLLFIGVVGAVLFVAGYAVGDLAITILGGICVLGAVYDL